MKSPFRYFKTSPEIICRAVMMYVCFPLSLRHVEDLLQERWIEVSHETIQCWWNRFGPIFAAEIRKKRTGRMRALSAWWWHRDEVFVKINGERHYLWRAVDPGGELLEAFVSKKRDRWRSAPSGAGRAWGAEEEGVSGRQTERKSLDCSSRGRERPRARTDPHAARAERKAREYAEAALNDNSRGWNQANRTHYGHLTLGRIALAEGNVEEAKYRLITAAMIQRPGTYDILMHPDILEDIMQVSKWGNSLAVRLPKVLVEDLGLKPGDVLEVVSATPERIAIAKDERRALAVERMRARAWSVPEDYVFDREEANAR